MHLIYPITFHTSQKLLERREKLMAVVDEINNRMGEKTVFNAAQGINQKWKLKADYFSKRYTTRWNELAIVH